MVLARLKGMSVPASAPSLMDDKEFVAELDVLESDVRGFVARTPKARSWSMTTAESPEELVDLYHFDEPAASAHEPMSIDAAEEPESEPERPRRADKVQRIPLLMFTLFMCLGASGAAAVFHDRVAHIVAHWQVGR